MLLGFPVLGNPDIREVELVHVGPDASVYRRSLTVDDDHTGAVRLLGLVGASFGGMAAVTGAALLPVGLARGSDGVTTAGGITLGAGAVLLALGLWATHHDEPTYRPSSSNHFPLAPAR